MATTQMSGLTDELANYQAEETKSALTMLKKLIPQADQVGDLLKIDYSECEVLVHDHLRQRVGGLPLGSFLLASRLGYSDPSGTN